MTDQAPPANSAPRPAPFLSDAGAHPTAALTLASQLDQPLFERVFDAAALGMAVVDLEGRWVRVNHAFCRILGYAPD